MTVSASTRLSRCRRAFARMLWTAPLVLTIVAGTAHAACTGDLPGRGVLNVFADATSESVIGGIGPNQCGLEVTDYCSGGRCLAFLDGLSGYVDVSALAGGTITQPPETFEYRVQAIDGGLRFMGQSQTFELAGNDTIRIEPRADHVVLNLPAPLPQGIRMTSTGSTGWEAVLPDWVGVPIPVSVYLERLSAARATLELSADHQMLEMDMRLTLDRLGQRPAQPTTTRQTAGSEAGSACNDTQALAVATGKSGDAAKRNAFFAAVEQVGITDWDTRTEPQCTSLLIALEKVGIPDPGPRPAQVATAPSTGNCGALVKDLRPVLRGPDSADKQAIIATMVTLGVTSIDPSNPKHCAEFAAAIGR